MGIGRHEGLNAHLGEIRLTIWTEKDSRLSTTTLRCMCCQMVWAKNSPGGTDLDARMHFQGHTAVQSWCNLVSADELLCMRGCLPGMLRYVQKRRGWFDHPFFYTFHIFTLIYCFSCILYTVHISIFLFAQYTLRQIPCVKTYFWFWFLFSTEQQDYGPSHESRYSVRIRKNPVLSLVQHQ